MLCLLRLATEGAETRHEARWRWGGWWGARVGDLWVFGDISGAVFGSAVLPSKLRHGHAGASFGPRLAFSRASFFVVHVAVEMLRQGRKKQRPVVRRPLPLHHSGHIVNGIRFKTLQVGWRDLEDLVRDKKSEPLPLERLVEGLGDLWRRQVDERETTIAEGAWVNREVKEIKLAEEPSGVYLLQQLSLDVLDGNLTQHQCGAPVEATSCFKTPTCSHCLLACPRNLVPNRLGDLALPKRHFAAESGQARGRLGSPEAQRDVVDEAIIIVIAVVRLRSFSIIDARISRTAAIRRFARTLRKLRQLSGNAFRGRIP